MQEEQVTIGGKAGRLYGVLYRPDEASRGSFVFCDPMFEERKSANRAMVEAARHLCGEGWTVLRFDYRGCGDSPGEFTDFCPADWVSDIESAATFLWKAGHGHSGPGGGNRGLLGLRLGATLAVQAAVRLPQVDRLVLWEPASSGADYFEQELRKKLMKEMVTFGRSRENRESLLRTLEQGGDMDFDGYAVSARLYKGLRDLHTDIPPAMKFRSLLIHIGHQSQISREIARLHQRFVDAGTAAETRAVVGKPFWNLIGYTDCAELFRVTAEWLRSARG